MITKRPFNKLRDWLYKRITHKISNQIHAEICRQIYNPVRNLSNERWNDQFNYFKTL